MPSPTVKDVHVSRPLTDVSIAYMLDPEDFIATKVAPIVSVDKQFDKYFVFDQADFLRDDAKPRADGAQSAGGEFKLSTDQYECIVYAWHEDLGPQMLANQDLEALDLEDATAELCTQKLALKQETQWAADVFKTGVWGTDATGGTTSAKWSVYASSDPLVDFRTARATIKKNTGRRANTVVLGYTLFEVLKSHPVIKDQIKYTSAKTMTAAMLAEVLEVDNVYVAGAVKATSNEGATDAFGFAIGDTSAWIGYVNPRPAKMMPSAMYTFAWKGMAGGLGEVIQTSREEIPLTGGAIRIEAQAAWHTKVTGKPLGYFFSVYA